MAADLSSLVAVGVNHRTAPVEVRERLALDEAGVKRHLDHLRSKGGCDEALLVSTCNRVELYVVGAADPTTAVKGWLGHFPTPNGEPIDRYLAWWRGRDAILHLFQVAGSLDSMVLGEPQILGQVKDAVRIAEESGSLGRYLGTLSRRTLSVAKRIRTETAIGKFRVGIGNAGVDLARQIFGNLKGRKALLIGTGEMGRQVAAAVLQEGLAELYVCNRTPERAVDLARELGGVANAVPWDRLEEHLGKVDIAITAVGGVEPILTPDLVSRAMRTRRYDPLFLVDLGVPRNIDAGVAKLDEAYLYNVDDLQRVLDAGAAAREAASREAMRIVEEEVNGFLLSLQEIQVGPLLGTVAKHAELIRVAELGRSKKLIDALDDEQRAQLDAMTKALVKKMLDAPLRALRDAARAGDRDRIDGIIAALIERKDGGTDGP